MYSTKKVQINYLGNLNIHICLMEIVMTIIFELFILINLNVVLRLLNYYSLNHALHIYKETV